MSAANSVARHRNLTRRTVMGALAAAPLAGMARAQEAAPLALPLTATFLEHMGSVVPDVAAETRFYSALFNPAIRTEQQPDPLRYYVDLNGGYLAFGSRPGVEGAFFDHFCAPIADYGTEAMKAALRGQGIEPAENFDVFGLYQDPDGIGVQLIADPGYWFPTVIDAEPLVDGPPVLTPQGLSHIVVEVGDLVASHDFYATWFAGVEAPDELGRVCVPLGPDELILTQAAPGVAPGIARVGVRAAPFDVEAAAAAAAELGGSGEVVNTLRGPVLRVAGPGGLSLDVVAAEA